MSTDFDVKISFYIKRSKLLKNGEAPIFARIVIENERDEYGLKLSINPNQWDNKKQIAKGRSEKSREINQQIEQHTIKIKSYFDFMVMDKQHITPRILKEKLIGKKEKRRTILKIFQDHNDEVKTERN